MFISSRSCPSGTDRGSSSKCTRFNVAFKNLPSCLLRRPALSKIVPLGLDSETFTHKIAGVPIIITCTKAVDPNTDRRGRIGAGSYVKGNGRSAPMGFCRYALLKLCVSLHILPSSFLIHIAWQTPLHGTAAYNTQRPA
jgi:hypothetical protein